MNSYIASEGILIFSLMITLIYSMGILTLYVANLIQRKFPKLAILTYPVRFIAILFLIYRYFIDGSSLLFDYQSDIKIPLELKPIIFIVIVVSIILMKKIETKTRFLKENSSFDIPESDNDISINIEGYKNLKELNDFAKQEGYSKAKYELGKIYYQGELVTQDIDFALYWIKKAVSEDYPEAQQLLLEIGNLKDTDTNSVIEYEEKYKISDSDSTRSELHSSKDVLWVKLIRYGFYLLFVSGIVIGIAGLYEKVTYNDYHYSFKKDYESKKGTEKECYYYSKGTYFNRGLYCGDYFSEKEFLVDLTKTYEFSFDNSLITDDILNHYTDNDVADLVEDFLKNNEIKYKTELKLDFDKLIIGCAIFIGAMVILFFLFKLFYRYLILAIQWLIKKLQEDDTPLYVEADKEIQGNNVDPGLWSKALVKANGNENKQKALYIKMRVKQLKNTQ